ncbi:MAG: amylo-alpha-1,6-glucosidase [Planctomycetaceae bacterium]|nr:amylo-alpha-1,6-glucosidase [Planctomycetaceae bacterium]
MNESTRPLPSPQIVPCQGADLDRLLSLEWLMTSGTGSYASGTAVGCNTRRYHGLLVAATAPPVGRVVALSNVTEELFIDGAGHELGNHEFVGTMSARGLPLLAEFRNDLAATFVFRLGTVELTKEILLARGSNTTAIRYTLRGGAARLHIRPLTAMRDFHHLRRMEGAPSLTSGSEGGVVSVADAAGGHVLRLSVPGATFQPAPDWWYSFHYRVEAQRGQDANEDLYTPGLFACDLADGQSCQLTATLSSTGVSPMPPDRVADVSSARAAGVPPALPESPQSGTRTTELCVAPDFELLRQQRRERIQSFVAGVGDTADEATRRLAAAAEAFIVRRDLPDGTPSSTIMAGYHWFADWGRDAFISLGGLLLTTRRFDIAREVFRTFAAALSQGMIPNCFDDRTCDAHYNSMDASLWFIIAADQYRRASGDEDFWHSTLLPAAQTIVAAYRTGTRFGIATADDGLLLGGSPGTQLTWMDAAMGGHVVTSRHGKAVEINAMWYCIHRILAQGTSEGGQYAAQAQQIAAAFVNTFWNEQAGCCYDCVYPEYKDASIRPNQVFAVSLPHSPLSPEQQAAVVNVVTQKLLTPYGLRTLAPDDPNYRGQCTGPQWQRDHAYHQGTVWTFLIGPFIEAYLKVNHNSPLARAQAKHWLLAIEDHLSEAGMGYISEIFDGDAPHEPRACIAQAWSVAEVLRVRHLLQSRAPAQPRPHA